MNVQIYTADRIGRVRADWADQRPDLDTSPMEVIGRILRAGHLAGARIRRVLRAEGLDRGGFDVLATLRRSGPPYRLTPTRLYQELVLTSGAITHRVDALGRAVADRAMAANLECEAAMIGALADADRETLAALLTKLVGGLEAEEAEVQ